MTALERIIEGIEVSNITEVGGTLTIQARAGDIIDFVKELNDLDRVDLLKTVFDYDTENYLWVALPSMINSLTDRAGHGREALALTLLGVRINMCLQLLVHAFNSSIPDVLFKDFLQGYEANYLERVWLEELNNSREGQTYIAAFKGDGLKQVYATTLNMN